MRNHVCVNGIISGEFKFSHECFGEVFYQTVISIERNSATTDDIPVIVSERLINIEETAAGTQVRITGEFRSHNEGRKLKLFIFAKEMEIVTDGIYINEVDLQGFICNGPVVRRTPKSGVQIADFMIAISRAGNKTDYIPCIAWNKNAKYIGRFDIGDEISILGRIQSREYDKKLDGKTERRTAYEVSVFKLQINEAAA